MLSVSVEHLCLLVPKDTRTEVAPQGRTRQLHLTEMFVRNVTVATVQAIKPKTLAKPQVGT